MTMRQELTKLLRAVPFVPFVVFTRDGEAQAVTNLKCFSLGRNVCAYLDQEGYLSLIPYAAIDRVSIKKSK
jgi:hypothetical protein